MADIVNLNTATTHHKPFSYWLSKNWYYHQFLINRYKFLISPNSSVLHIGCKNGYLLNAIKPAHGVGIDTNCDELALAHENRLGQNYQFFASVHELPETTFDYIVVSSVTMETNDIQEELAQLQKYCHPRTRILVDAYSYIWEPLLTLAQKMGRRRPTQLTNWVTLNDLRQFLHLADFEVVSQEAYMLFPFYVPLLSWFINSCVAPLPLIRQLCVSKITVARPAPKSQAYHSYSVSVIIPCKNEKGNIEAAVLSTPNMGYSTELIFVEGHSKDNTLEEIKRVQAAYPEKNISWYVQDGKGKAAAVRTGFAHATGDILMILDADLTTPPEDMSKFYHALATGKGDFINGSRLVYKMEAHAMSFAAMLANRFFSALLSWIINQKISDTMCGTKVFFKADYQKIIACRETFGSADPFGDFDLLFAAAKLTLKIVDLPIRYKDRVYGATNIHRFYDVWFLFFISAKAIRKFKMH